MNTEHDTTRIVEAWLAEPEPPLDDRVIDQTIDRLPGTRQRRRWWPIRWFPLGIGATRNTGPSEAQPHGRSRSMFTATRVAAVVAIVALGSSLALISGPLGPSSDPAVAPGAATPSAEPAASDGVYFTGKVRWDLGMPYAPDIDEQGVERIRDTSYTVEFESTDPRFSGPGEVVGGTNTYPTDSGGEISVSFGTWSLENEQGTWRGSSPGSGIVRETDSRAHQWFAGEGAFEGMSAYVVMTVEQPQMAPYYWYYEGWIVPGDAHLTEMFE